MGIYLKEGPWLWVCNNGKDNSWRGVSVGSTADVSHTDMLPVWDSHMHVSIQGDRGPPRKQPDNGTGLPRLQNLPRGTVFIRLHVMRETTFKKQILVLPHDSAACWRHHCRPVERQNSTAARVHG